jgi:hypothetical protein
MGCSRREAGSPTLWRNARADLDESGTPGPFRAPIAIIRIITLLGGATDGGRAPTLQARWRCRCAGRLYGCCVGIR